MNAAEKRCERAFVTVLLNFQNHSLLLIANHFQFLYFVLNIYLGLYFDIAITTIKH